MPPNPTQNVGQLQRCASAKLQSQGIETAALDVRLIVLDALQLSHEDLIAQPDRQLSNAERKRIEDNLNRRIAHEPVSRIIGSREFYGRRFVITPDVLDPRPDTETLIEQVLEMTHSMGSPHVLDVGTGSGAIIATLMAELPKASGAATDISPAALEVARRNAVQHGVESRITFAQTAWLDRISDRYDVIVSNPPYIESSAIEHLAPEVAHFDPHLSLDGGADGLDAYRSIVPQAFDRLSDGGFLCFEVGAGQADRVADLMVSAGFSFGGPFVAQRCDLGGHIRVVTGRKT